MFEGRQLFTSESVSMGHPDKVADQISDSILDAIYREDPKGRVAVETLVTTGLCVVAGEVTTSAKIDYEQVVRRTIKEIGYTAENLGFSAEGCGVMVAIHRQSPDIAMGVDEGKDKEQGAGDQGLMFGFACDETPELMPLPIALAHRIMILHAQLRESKKIAWLRPDAKSQVTVEYDGDRPVRVSAVVVSTQHAEDVDNKTIRETVIEQLVKPVIPAALLDAKTVYHVNPTGRFVIGGPAGDSGVTGRKIIVDTYGGMGRHGGGAFSGKDPSKVDRSACYMMRYIAKNIVAAGLARRAEVQVAYAIGVAEPVSVFVNTFGTGKIADDKLAAIVREVFPLKPKGLIEHLDLRRPIFRETAKHGHFGRELPEFTWERKDKVDALRAAADRAGGAAAAGEKPGAGASRGKAKATVHAS